MIYLLIAVLVGLAVLGLGFAFGRKSDVLSDVERFHRARQMTTAWSNEAQRPPAAEPAAADAAARE